MILRRFTQHIKEQNWFAIGLDVIVVIVGIFLGMQVTEWNEERKEKIEWELALDNLQSEFILNTTNIDVIRDVIHQRVSAVSDSLRMLYECKMPIEGMESFQDGLNRARGTTGVAIRTRVLESVLIEPKYQAVMDPRIKLYLQELLTKLEYYEVETAFYENLPFDDMPEKHDAVKLLADEKDEYTKFSVLVLAVPFETACNDQKFIKSLDWWVNWQSQQLDSTNDLITIFNEASETAVGWKTSIATE